MHKQPKSKLGWSFLFLCLVISGSLMAAQDPKPLSDLSLESFEKQKLPKDNRNPFAPGDIDENVSASNLNLEGIILGPATQICLISGQILRVGDAMGNFTIKSISRDGVTLEAPNDERLLTMDKSVPSHQNSGSLYDLFFKNAGLKEALRIIATAGKFNLILPEDMSGQVTLSFNDTLLKDALSSILRVNGYEFAEENSIVRVGKPADFGEGGYFETTQIPLRYANAKEMAGKIKNFLSDKGSVVADERTNTISIKDRKSVIEDLWAIIQKFDLKDPQIRIEAKILDVTRTFSRALGIQWGITRTVTNGVSGFGASGAGSSSTTSNPFNVNLPAGNPTSGAGILIGQLAGGLDIEAQITAAEANGDIHVISRPSVTTVNNQPANIRSGVKIYVKATSDITVGTSSGTGGGSSSGLEEINTGVELTVTPQITDNNTIKLKIEAVESQADFSRTVDGIPAVIDNTASTTVLVRDGETTIIGGMIKTDKSKSVSSVPGFSKIPILGWFFKSKSQDKTDNELLIFITPHLVSESVIDFTSTQDNPSPVIQVTSDETLEPESPTPKKKRKRTTKPTMQ